MPFSLTRLYVPVFSLTLILSAFLLFLVQPMMGKMLLPLLGGTPAVWNTAMVFFQAVLLAGYGYAHLTTRYLSPTIQAALHVVLLAVFSVILPIAVPEGWTPPATDNPAFWQLSLMAVMVGGPFFVVAGTAPMMQRWFSNTDHPDADNPYFLYAASNLGSMSALLFYPFLIEPLLTLGRQSAVWANGYFILIGLSALCGLMTWLTLRGQKKQKAQADATPEPSAEESITRGQVGIWLLLAFIPSSLMLGVTTFMTTDLASVPLLWLLPLTIYVGTFIVAFARKQVVNINQLLFWQALALLAVIGLSISRYPLHITAVIAVHLTLFTTTTLYCHIRLAALKPSAKNLTAFYLTMSLGGVLGGMFNALLAPVIFKMPLEYPITLALGMLVRYQGDPEQSWSSFKPQIKNLPLVRKPFVFFPILVLLLGIAALSITDMYARFSLAVLICLMLVAIFDKRWLFGISTAAILLLHNGSNLYLDLNIIHTERNFFGVMRIADTPENYRFFLHGTTLHGAQSLAPEYKKMPITYYYKKFSPVSDTFKILDRKRGTQEIGVIGLGVGMLACYSKEGRHIDFYDIDPDVARIAENPDYFTYLSGCGTPYDIIIGDGRLRINEAPDNSYNMIFLDAFSSDNIPIHILTTEAFKTYFKKLKPDGFVVAHISNRHIALEPVIAAMARDQGWTALFKVSGHGLDKETGLSYLASQMAVVAKDGETLALFREEFKGWEPNDISPSYKAWHDDYSNLVRALRIKMPVVTRE